MPNKIIVLSDSLCEWHSYWIRIGQYLQELSWKIEATTKLDKIYSLKKGDILILYRYNRYWGNMIDILNILREREVKIISDIDDFLWEAPYWDKTRLKGLTENLKRSHIITCSTNNLKDMINFMFPKSKAIVLPNTTPKKRLVESIEEKGVLRLLWTGAPWTRENDLLLLKPLAEWINQNQLNIKWVHIGNLEGKRSFAEILKINSSEVKAYPLMGYHEYLKTLKGDIGLAPLSKKNSFNSFKSEIKLLEYSGIGIPWIASKAKAYEELAFRFGLAGRFCEDDLDWIKHLEALLDDKARKKEGLMWKEKSQILQNFDSGVKNWKIIIEDLLM